jgi:nitrous oxide reductase accessory protein NosL
MHVFRLTIVVFCLASVVLLTGTMAPPQVEGAPVAVSKTDKCPVCGMFVARYPDFLTQIVFTDNSHAFFDGAKDMFKYYFNLKRYTGSKKPTDIASIYVTDYYGMKPIDGRTAWYVAGSDVYGPMGRELLPFEQEADAKEFMKDHLGKKLLRFNEVTPEVMKGLE